MTDFRGVYPAIVTPMTPDGGVSEEAFRAVMEFNIQSGVHGFWVAGGTGESILLDDEENNRIAEWAADQARGRIKNIMHVGAPNTRRAIAMAEHAAKAGVDAVCAVPPFFYRPGDEGVDRTLQGRRGRRRPAAVPVQPAGLHRGRDNRRPYEEDTG